MPERLARRLRPGGFLRFLPVLLSLLAGLMGLSAGSTAQAAEPVQVLRSALSARGEADSRAFPVTAPARNVQLPDEWWATRPREDGPIWYRLTFAAPQDGGGLMAAYVPRACSNLEVYLNGALVGSGGPMTEPMARNCFYPQLFALPAALLRPGGNVLDIKVAGYALQKVSGRQRAGGLSEIEVGPYAELAETHASRLFWRVSVIKAMTVTLVVLGLYMLYLGWLNRQDVHLFYFGLFLLGWAASSARMWWQNAPVETAAVEFMTAVSFGLIAAAAVQFLLSHVGLRSRTIEIGLVVQIAAVPLTLWLAGPNRLFVFSNAWYLLLSMGVITVMGLYLWVSWKVRRTQFWFMGGVLLVMATLMGIELAMQYELIPMMGPSPMHLGMPMLLLLVGAWQLRGYGRALQAAEADRMSLETRINEATAEIERNYAQMADLRVEQVTEKERKRIAADLHDDLGAKLLTIVHTSESERISSLAREALEEMRLSVRGLTGKPMQVADALADWRAETVLRLGQAGIEADWKSPTEDVTQQLSARAFVQTTRILREAVSNIIKHSGASHCKVRCSIGESEFQLIVQDNGKGIPMELDGKLDRGHGMASMKHRAKQMQGQCLVESGPGYGTVIRLTLPL
jgi:two-component system, NarL family, sensor histidine kinase UhpB